MTPFIIMIPLMVLAVAIATIPILYVSLREHNLVRFGNSKRPASGETRVCHSENGRRQCPSRLLRSGPDPLVGVALSRGMPRMSTT